MSTNTKTPSGRHLALGTISFTVCFAAWGLISAFAPHFRQGFTCRLHRPPFLSRFPYCSVLWRGFRWEC